MHLRRTRNEQMNTTFTAEEYPVLEPGVYPALFDRLEEPDEVGQYGPYFNWFFTVTTSDGQAEVMGRSSKPDYFTRSTKARQWYEAILGRELSKGEAADQASLRGTHVKLTVDIVKTERGDERNRIVNIRREESGEDSSSTAGDPPPNVDPDFEAWKADQAGKKAVVDATNPEGPPTPSEQSEEAA
jgi:hypothetical protein